MHNFIEINCPKYTDIRLYSIHHAGGSHILYRPWARSLPEWIEMIALEAPGRGLSFGEPFSQTLEDVVDLFLSEIKTDKPFAIFGHSMGALIAYELTLRLQEKGIHPVWLGLSAFLPPHLKNEEKLCRSTYDDKELIDYLSKLGGAHTAEEYITEPAVMKMILEVIRSDFRLIDNWNMSSNVINQQTKVHCFSGTDDYIVKPEMMSHWQEYIASPFHHTTFPGGHFYFDTQHDDLLNAVTGDLQFLR